MQTTVRRNEGGLGVGFGKPARDKASERQPWVGCAHPRATLGAPRADPDLSRSRPGVEGGDPAGRPSKEFVGAQPIECRGTGWASTEVNRGAQGSPPRRAGGFFQLKKFAFNGCNVQITNLTS